MGGIFCVNVYFVILGKVKLFFLYFFFRNVHFFATISVGNFSSKYTLCKNFRENNQMWASAKVFRKIKKFPSMSKITWSISVKLFLWNFGKSFQN